MMPPLAIVFLTYGGTEARREYAYKTIHMALDRLRYSGPMRVIIADDGSPAPHAEVCAEIAGGYASIQSVEITNSERRGYGANWNLAAARAKSIAEIVMPIEDDWELMHELDLDPLVNTLRAELGISCIRLGYLGFTDLIGGYLVAKHGEGGDGGGVFLRFDSNSPETHIAAGHPRLETVGWEESIGPWVEGVSPGDTELDWCGRPAARVGVAWPMHLSRSGGDIFAHIGSVHSTDEA